MTIFDTLNLKFKIMNKPNNLITKEEATKLSKDFNVKNKLIGKHIGKPSNCSTWYSLADLEEYIAYIKAEGKAKGYSVDGIRFYLGSYSKNNSNVKKQRQTTVFLAPTGNKVTQEKTMKMVAPTSSPDITDIDPLNFGNDGIPPDSNYPN